MILNQIAYGGGGTTPRTNPWTGRPRPEDWPSLPATADNTFNGLISVWDVPDGNRVALSVTAEGGFTVDWGDGSTPDTWASGATAEHQYDYADADLTAVDGGYKVALVQVTSTTTGSNWSVFSLQKRHSALTAVHESHWLDINVTGSELTTLEISKETQVVRMAFLWGAAFGVSIGTSSLAFAFQNCYSLTTAPVLPVGFNQSLSGAFRSCYSLTTPPVLPAGFNQSLSGAFSYCSILTTPPVLPVGFNGSLEAAFYECSSLTTPPVLPAGFNQSLSGAFSYCSSLTTPPVLPAGFNQSLDNAFNSCYSLTTPPVLPAGFNQSLAYAFQGCSSLTTAPVLPAGFNQSLSGAFSYCSSLTTPPVLPAGFNQSLDNAFNSCYSLTTPPVLPAGFNQSLSGAFRSCSSLTTAPALPAGFNQSLSAAFANCYSLTAASGYSQASNMSNTFTGCSSLEAGALIGTRLSTNYASCNLSPSALNAIYAGLADLNAYTITGATGDGTTATYTTSTAHRIIVGQQVTITGVNPAGYNVTAGVVTAINGDTFSLARTETGTYVSGGAIAATAGRVVTVTGNWGVSGDDPTIATLKNWTVTG